MFKYIKFSKQLNLILNFDYNNYYIHYTDNYFYLMKLDSSDEHIIKFNESFALILYFHLQNPILLKEELNRCEKNNIINSNKFDHIMQFVFCIEQLKDVRVPNLLKIELLPTVIESSEFLFELIESSEDLLEAYAFCTPNGAPCGPGGTGTCVMNICQVTT